MNENRPDLKPCPDTNCARRYGHMTGCRVQALHERLDELIESYSLEQAEYLLITPKNLITEKQAAFTQKYSSTRGGTITS